MAEAGSFAEKVKQQADIVRVVGEYVRLKKTGKDFSGLCPFHQEKTPSFTVSPLKQIFYCFGCGKGGDVYNFVMDMEKCEFLEAVKLVAEKCGIPIPRPKERSPEERKENQQRAVLVEMHREAQTFFVKQLQGTLEGKAARAYLEDRGLDKDAVTRFGIGYAPSGGDELLRHLKSKYNEKLLVESGLISREQQGGRLFDRFRRRITFPISNESGKIVAFGCRALGDDQPKYLNSPETPIYSKSNVLYHLDRAKEGIRRQDFAILVEGYMDAIAVARAGISNVVASCGTSLAEQQIKLLARFTRRVVVNYDPDAAGQSATERSLSLLLEQDFEVRVLALPPVGDKKADPDLFIREKSADEYLKLLKEAPSYVDYLISRARQMDLSTGEAKSRAVNFLLPYVQKIPNRILRSEWATRIAQQLRVDEPVLRAALSKAAAERRGELKLQPELVGRAAKPVERRLIRMLAEAEGFRQDLAQRLQNAQLYHGLETEKIFAALVIASLSGQPVQAAEVAAVLQERDRRLLFEILFEEASEPTWEEALSCIEALQHRQAEQELAEVQRSIEASPTGPDLRDLLTRKQELMRRLAAAR
ncbi:MAG: DNA primase [Acidobacteria bacterium 13_1_40CM_4_58_4]|nr:MAG: DNA primase [Acidobacteria bacterium 13_1_40CM_4_58_4]